MEGGGTNILNIAIHVRVKSPETYREMYVRVGEMCVCFFPNLRATQCTYVSRFCQSSIYIIWP